MFSTKEIPIGLDWLENVREFVHWCYDKQRELIPEGVQGQSISIGSGQDTFLKKYKTFEDAYKDYEEDMNEFYNRIMEEED